MIWLSHHPRDQLHRTYRLGGVHLCARCTGLYPVLFCGMALLFAVHAPLHWRWDVPFAIALTVPALVDWSVGQFRPVWGGNAQRTLTGALLGVALARTLYVHVQKPLPEALIWQLGLAVAVAVPVLLLSSRFRRAVDPASRSRVE